MEKYAGAFDNLLCFSSFVAVGNFSNSIASGAFLHVTPSACLTLVCDPLLKTCEHVLCSHVNI